MATEKRTTRQKKLDRIIANIARFGVSETYTDERQAQEHLSNAMKELETASKMLAESGS